MHFPAQWNSIPEGATRLRESLLLPLQLATEMKDALECRINAQGSEENFAAALRTCAERRWDAPAPSTFVDDMAAWRTFARCRERWLAHAPGNPAWKIRHMRGVFSKMLVAAREQQEFGAALDEAVRELYSATAKFCDPNRRLSEAPTLVSLDVLSIRREQARALSIRKAQLGINAIANVTAGMIVRGELDARIVSADALVKSKYYRIRGGLCSDEAEYFAIAAGKYSSKDVRDKYADAHRMYAACIREVEAAADRDGEVARCHRDFALYCDAVLSWEADVDEGEALSFAESKESLLNTYVRELLQAMALGDEASFEMFPSVLIAVDRAKSQLVLDTFAKAVRPECFAVSRLLPWSDQLLSRLGTNASAAMLPLIEAIALRHPYDLVYSFRMSEETRRGKKIAADTGNLPRILKNERVDTFVKELYKLIDCQKRFKSAVERAATSRDAVDEEAWARLVAAPVEEALGRERGRSVGSIDRKFAKMFIARLDKNKLRASATSSSARLGSYSSRGLAQKLKKACAVSEDAKHPNDAKALMLANGDNISKASRWLADYCADAYEPPYCNNDDSDLDAFSRARCIKLPGMGNSGVSIRTFGTAVQVITSKERPRVISVWGDDERRYKFLVKDGDDLRQDRRIQQAFNVINSALRRDAACKARRLAIETYAVVPMLPKFGLIEWIDGTRPVLDLVKKEWKKRVKKRPQRQPTFNDALQDYANDAVESYERQYASGKDEEVAARYRVHSAKCPFDLLRRQFDALSASPEHFLQLRENYLHSLASFSIAGYVLGSAIATWAISISGVRLSHHRHRFWVLIWRRHRITYPRNRPLRLTPLINALQPLAGADMFART